MSLPAFILFFTMLGFGSFSQRAGFELEMAIAASMLIWGLPGQLVMADLSAAGQPILVIVFACSLANARFLPMVVSFLPMISRADTKLSQLILDAQLLSINSWAMCLREFPDVEPNYRRQYFVIFASVILFAGLAGTVVGHVGSVVLPHALVLGFIFASPLFFALVLSAVPSFSYRVAMIAGCVIMPLMHYWLPSFDLLLSGLIGGSIAFLIDREKRGKA